MFHVKHLRRLFAVVLNLEVATNYFVNRDILTPINLVVVRP